MKLFGAMVLQEGDELVAAPVGQLCGWCGEAIEEGDAGVLGFTAEMPHHVECWTRRIQGSVGHQLGFCGACPGCVGEGYHDPPGMTKREAAWAAYLQYRRGVDLRGRIGRLVEALPVGETEVDVAIEVDLRDIATWLNLLI